MTNKEFFNAVLGIEDQARDIFEHFHAVPKFDAWIKSNEFGGNPSYHVSLNIEWRLPMKKVEFEYHPAWQTLTGFVNEIKAYLFSCVDTFVNL